MSEQVIVKDQRLDHWYKVDNALLLEYGSIIGVYGIAVYSVLAMHANQENEAYPSYQTIADMIGCSRRKVIQTMELLESLNIIRGEGRFDTKGSPMSNVWVLVDKSNWGDDGGKKDRSLHEVVNPVHYPSASHSPPSAQDSLSSAHGAPKQEVVNKNKLTKKRESHAHVPEKPETIQPQKPKTSLSQDDERKRLCRNAMLLVCYKVDTATLATPNQQSKVVEAFKTLDKLYQPISEKILGFANYWWGSTPPSPNQMVEEWSRYLASGEKPVSSAVKNGHARRATAYRYFDETPYGAVVS